MDPIPIQQRLARLETGIVTTMLSLARSLEKIVAVNVTFFCLPFFF